MAKARKSTTHQTPETRIEGVDLALPLVAEVETDGFRVRLEADLVNGRLECTRLVVEHREDGPPITGEALRRLPIRQLVNGATSPAAIVSVNPPVGFPGNGPTDDALRYIATIYRWANATGQHPTQAVQWASDLPRATAGRWISKARQKGYLGPAEAPGKAGG